MNDHPHTQPNWHIYPVLKLTWMVSISALLLLSLSGTAVFTTARGADESAADAETAAIEKVEGTLSGIVSKSGLPALWAARYDAPQPSNAERETLRKREFVYGVRKLESETPAEFEDIVHLGSCTKAMTALLIAQLVSTDSDITWESRLGEVLSHHQALAASAWADVTILEMLRHRSGFPANAPWQTIHNRLPDDILAARAAVVDWLAEQTPPKKRRFLYSNVNYAVLGHILESKAGMPWEDIIRQRLFKPLGIQSAGFGPPGLADGVPAVDADPQRTLQPWGHHVEPSVISALSNLFGAGNSAKLTPIRFDNAPPLGPAGRVHMKVTDWAKFLQLYLRDDAPAQINGLTNTDWKMLQEPGNEGTYAGGWMVVERGWAGGNALSHSGSNTMWHCIAWIAPKRNFFVLAATNCHKDNVPQALDKAVSELIRQF